MPEATLDAVADHGQVRGNTIQQLYDDARDHLAALRRLGIDYDGVVKVLEEEGVQKFEASWQELLGTITSELETVSARSGT
jgi:transaldolase